MFILKVTNLKTGKVQQSDFATIEECEAHFQKYKAVGFWGKESQIVHHEEQIIHHEEVIITPYSPAIEEVKDELGNVVTPAIPEVLEEKTPAYDEVIPAYDEQIPAEYTYVIEDHTAEVEQAKLNAESLKYLAETDWLVVRSMETGIEIPAYIKTTRQMARNNIAR